MIDEKTEKELIVLKNAFTSINSEHNFHQISDEEFEKEAVTYYNRLLDIYKKSKGCDKVVIDGIEFDVAKVDNSKEIELFAQGFSKSNLAHSA